MNHSECIIMYLWTLKRITDYLRLFACVQAIMFDPALQNEVVEHSLIFAMCSRKTSKPQSDKNS